MTDIIDVGETIGALRQVVALARMEMMDRIARVYHVNGASLR